MIDIRNATRPVPDLLFTEIADYVLRKSKHSEETYATAHLCLLDSLGCALQALQFPACTKLLGPIVDDAQMLNGYRVPGTSYRLDLVQAAFNIGCMIRWLDYNDTWLAAEWGHPSDNLGGLLSVAQYVSRQRIEKNQLPLKMQEVLHAMINAYEIQGVLALNNSFNQVGLDHVLLVRIATCASSAALLGANKTQIINAVSNAWLDGGALRTYRHAPNTGSRKSWAAGDASSRGVWHALMALKGEMGYPSALSTDHWGFNAVLFAGKTISLERPLASYVMDNILFKVSVPAEFHAQTAVEAALQLHSKIKDRIADIDHIVLETQYAACRIIDKTGPLNNPADRDHCLQYMVAIALLYGRLSAMDYEDDMAKNAAIDTLRNKMLVRENAQYSTAYLDPVRRSISNAVQVFFKDASATDRIEVEYPLGHKRRRKEALPLLQEKFYASLDQHYGQLNNPELKKQLQSLFTHPLELSDMTIGEFMALFP